MTMSSTTAADAVALDKDLSSVTRSLFFPLMLMLNFSFFQYLVLLFHARWREKRVLLLLLVSAISVGTLVPFASQSDEAVANLNDVSESCLALILLVQTALVGTRHAPKGKTAATAKLIGSVSKPLQLCGSADPVCLWRGDPRPRVLFKPAIATEFGGTIVINNVAENVTLAFTFVYRFGELGRSKGWKMMKDDKWEIFCHVVFMMHEYPFMLLESVTHVSWKYLQAIFMRLALTPCVWMTIGEHHAQRVSVFFDLQRISVPGVDLKAIVRRASLDTAGIRGGGNDTATNNNGYRDDPSCPPVKRSAVISVSTSKDEDEEREQAHTIKSLGSEEIRPDHIVPMIDPSATCKNETLSDQVDDKLSREHVPAQ